MTRRDTHELRACKEASPFQQKSEAMRQHIPWDAFETALWPKKKIRNVRSAPTRTCAFVGRSTVGRVLHGLLPGKDLVSVTELLSLSTTSLND